MMYCFLSYLSLTKTSFSNGIKGKSFHQVTDIDPIRVRFFHFIEQGHG